jgi:hypothetical protein
MSETRAPILHSHLPVRPWASLQGMRLPGLMPLAPDEWLVRDEVFAEQMAYRDHLVTEETEEVVALQPGAEDAAGELLAELLGYLTDMQGYEVTPDSVLRPDGVRVELGAAPALETCGRLVQEDLLLMQKPGDTHDLVGGVLCFPALWRLREKVGRTLFDVHRPVAPYTEDLSSRVERVLSVLRTGQVLMRANALIYERPDLYQPASEGAPKALTPGTPRYVRVERQTFRRLPQTRAVVFAIHTYLVAAEQLGPDDHASLAEIRPDLLS